MDNRLRTRLAAVRIYLLKHAGADGARLAEEFEEQLGMEQEGAWRQMADLHGHWVYRSPAIAEEIAAPPLAEAVPTHERARTVTIGGRPLRVLTAASSGNIVQIGTPKTSVVGLGVASPLLLILASAGGYWMSDRALKPVEEIALTVKQIGLAASPERLALHERSASARASTSRSPIRPDIRSELAVEPMDLAITLAEVVEEIRKLA